MEWIPVLVVAVLVLIIIVRNIYVVQQSKAYVVERLGAFSAVWTARAQGDTPIAAGTTATVLRIEGVKLIVTPVCVHADANE